MDNIVCMKGFITLCINICKYFGMALFFLTRKTVMARSVKSVNAANPSILCSACMYK